MALVALVKGLIPCGKSCCLGGDTGPGPAQSSLLRPRPLPQQNAGWSHPSDHEQGQDWGSSACEEARVASGGPLGRAGPSRGTAILRTDRHGGWAESRWLLWGYQAGKARGCPSHTGSQGGAGPSTSSSSQERPGLPSASSGAGTQPMALHPAAGSSQGLSPGMSSRVQNDTHLSWHRRVGACQAHALFRNCWTRRE